ncbi:MAG: dihydrofolate reductase family protein [Thermomicrobiales bacterium]
MRKIIVSTYVTLDGVIQPLDWSMQSQDPASAEERGKYARDLLFDADALLMGRGTYEIFAGSWPTRTSADDGPGEAGASDRMNSLPKYVASTTLKEPLSWNSTLLGDDVPKEIAKLKVQPGKNIVMYGCGQLAKTLIEHDLADEFRFWMYPVVRGRGTRLFEDGINTDFELVDTRAFGGGFAVLTCRPKKTA